MFGDFCFADVTFSGILQVIIINYKNVHGRTKVVAIVDGTTGKLLVIDPVKYHGQTRVQEIINNTTGSLKVIDLNKYKLSTNVTVIKPIKTSVNTIGISTS